MWTTASDISSVSLHTDVTDEKSRASCSACLLNLSSRVPEPNWHAEDWLPIPHFPKEILLGTLTLCGSSKKSLNLLGREYFFTNSSSTTHGAFSPMPARSALCRMKYLRISLLGGRSVRTKLSAGTLLMILEISRRPVTI